MAVLACCLMTACADVVICMKGRQRVQWVAAGGHALARGSMFGKDHGSGNTQPFISPECSASVC